MILSLQVIDKNEDCLRLGRSRAWRFIFIFIALFLTAGVIVTGEAPVLYIIFLAGSLFGGLFDEKWEFKRQSGCLKIRAGIGPLSKKREYSLPLFSNLFIASAVSFPMKEKHVRRSGNPIMPDFFRKGRTTLWLEYRDSEKDRLLIDEGTHRDKESLKNLGMVIAGFCGIPLIQQEGNDEQRHGLK